MASASSSLRRAVLRPATRQIFASRMRTISTTPCRRNDQPTELGVGELEGAKFKIEPLRRVGEDDNTKRARLLCTSRTFLPLEQGEIFV